MADNNQECAHDNCACVAAADSKYCSEMCEEAADTKVTTIFCDCGHPGCGTDNTVRA